MIYTVEEIRNQITNYIQVFDPNTFLKLTKESYMKLGDDVNSKNCREKLLNLSKKDITFIGAHFVTSFVMYAQRDISGTIIQGILQYHLTNEKDLADSLLKYYVSFLNGEIEGNLVKKTILSSLDLLKRNLLIN